MIRQIALLLVCGYLGAFGLALAQQSGGGFPFIPFVMNNSGMQATPARTVIGTTTLVLGSSTVTLSGPAIFSSATSYVCVGSDSTATAVGVGVANLSGSSFRVFDPNAGGTVSYICQGN